MGPRKETGLQGLGCISEIMCQAVSLAGSDKGTQAGLLSLASRIGFTGPGSECILP